MIFFLSLNKNICCGYSLEAPRRGASNEYEICFLSEIRKISAFLDKKKHLICCYEQSLSLSPFHHLDMTK